MTPVAIAALAATVAAIVAVTRSQRSRQPTPIPIRDVSVDDETPDADGAGAAHSWEGSR